MRAKRVRAKLHKVHRKISRRNTRTFYFGASKNKTDVLLKKGLYGKVTNSRGLARSYAKRTNKPNYIAIKLPRKMIGSYITPKSAHKSSIDRKATVYNTRRPIPAKFMKRGRIPFVAIS